MTLVIDLKGLYIILSLKQIVFQMKFKSSRIFETFKLIWKLIPQSRTSVINRLSRMRGPYKGTEGWSAGLPFFKMLMAWTDGWSAGLPSFKMLTAWTDGWSAGLTFFKMLMAWTDGWSAGLLSFKMLMVWTDGWSAVLPSNRCWWPGLMDDQQGFLRTDADGLDWRMISGASFLQDADGLNWWMISRASFLRADAGGLDWWMISGASFLLGVGKGKDDNHKIFTSKLKQKSCGIKKNIFSAWNRDLVISDLNWTGNANAKLVHKIVFLN